MATVAQITKCRRLLQDMYDGEGVQLTTATQAFADDELNDLIDDAFAEVTEGSRTALTAVPADTPLAMLIARADGILMIAQDETRRKKWEINNKVIDDTNSAKGLIAIAKELRQRYESHKKRQLDRDLNDKTERPAGGVLHLNPTVDYHYNRDFDNRDVRRNRPRH